MYIKSKKIIMALLVLMMLLSSCADKKSIDETTKIQPVSDVESDSLVTAKSFADIETQAPHSDEPPSGTASATPKTLWYSQAEYDVGVDIPAGDYYIKALPKEQYDTNSFIVYKKETDEKRTHLQGLSFDNFCYISVKDGQILKLKNAKMIAENQAPLIEKTDGFYPSGTYRVGKDIPAGIYYFEVVNSESFAFAYTLNSYTDEGFPDADKPCRQMPSRTFGYLYADEGTYLFVLNARFIAEAQAPSPKSNNGIFGDGMYLVGRDIKEGKYKLTKNKGANLATYFIYKDAKFKEEELIEKDFFPHSKNITIENGQYFEVRDATFVEKD